MAELKFPTLEELGRQGGEWALDVFEYRGHTIREWADKITTGEYQPVKHGHWIDNTSGQECSVCSEIQHGFDNFRNYCANCGAKMDGGVDNDEP